jgi:hypothetical protein
MLFQRGFSKPNMPWHVSAMKSSQLVSQLAGGHTVSQPLERAS